MITLTKIVLLVLLINFVTKETRPVKLSISLVIIRGIIMLLLNALRGESWFPIIFYLLFIGGIIIIFIILSSVRPNEKMPKLKNYITFAIILSTISTLSYRNQNTCASNILKEVLIRNHNVLSLTALVLVYFLAFIYLISKNKIPLRSTMCYIKILIL